MSYDYYTLKVKMLHADGTEQVVRYSMTRAEFNKFNEKVLAPDGTKVISVEDIHEYRDYYS